MLVKVKDHIRRHQTKYIVGVTVVVTAGITYAITRRVTMRHMFVSERGVLINKGVIKENVMLINTCTRTQGPPSYMVRCLETGGLWVSQEAAARAMRISESMLSTHLNGKASHAGGYTFTRVAMAVPGQFC